LIRVEGLTKRYGEHTVVDHISFHLERGQIYGLLGPNGAGKSTTMKMVTGCLFPTEGSVFIAGHDLLQEPEEAKRCIGYLPELPPLYRNMTPREYLLFMAEIKGLPKESWNRQVEEVMEKTHITHMQDRLIRHLSKGYTQRVGIAQALLGSPQLLILDEPMVGLDPTQIIEIRSLIKSLAQDHTVILCSHILAEVSAICSRILIISDGKLIANDTADNLRSRLQEQELLNVTVACEPQRARELLEGVDGVSRMELHPTEDGCCAVALYQENGADVQDEVMRRLREGGCRVVQMGVSTMSLEDVFLSLLQRSKQEQTDEKGEQ